MIESILNTVFSIPYLLLGVLFAVILDLFIYKSKASTRLSLIEILGCAMCWPVILIIDIVAYFITSDN